MICELWMLGKHDVILYLSIKNMWSKYCHSWYLDKGEDFQNKKIVKKSTHNHVQKLIINY